MSAPAPIAPPTAPADRDPIRRLPAAMNGLALSPFTPQKVGRSRPGPAIRPGHD